MFNKGLFETKRLLMRPFSEDDQAYFLELVSEAEAQKFFDIGKTLEEISDFFIPTV